MFGLTRVLLAVQAALANQASEPYAYYNTGLVQFWSVPSYDGMTSSETNNTTLSKDVPHKMLSRLVFGELLYSSCLFLTSAVIICRLKPGFFIERRTLPS